MIGGNHENHKKTHITIVHGENMKPVMQTDTTFNMGNCGEACLASILEIDLRDIPQLHDQDDPQNGYIYCKNLREFVSKFGLSYIDMAMSEGHEAEDFFKDCWAIASGPSPRGTEEWHRHAVVWRNGKIIHDPHPSQSGLEKIETYGVFIELAPETHHKKIKP